MLLVLCEGLRGRPAGVPGAPRVEAHLAGHDDFAAKAVDCHARRDADRRAVGRDLQSAQHATAERQPVQHPALVIEVLLLHAQMKLVEQLAVEVVIAAGRGKRCEDGVHASSP
jgi:hypothetical protein